MTENRQTGLHIGNALQIQLLLFFQKTVVAMGIAEEHEKHRKCHKQQQ